MIIAVSGLLLGWKKNSGDLLLPSTRQGSTSGLSGWMPVDSLAIIARKTLEEEVSPGLSPEIDRMDIRPSRGIIKFVFKHHYWGIQLDGKTGEVLHVGRRNSDLIENIHDGSVIDRMLGSGRIGFKLVYTSLTGLSLLLFTITGIWLWTGRNRIKKQKRT
jgi:uncharacterized iron-regulated membrane protein